MTTDNRGANRISLVRDRPSGVEAVRARFVGHAYDPHRHDEWLVGVTDSGFQDFFCRGARRVSTTGRVILIEPGELHDGRAGGESGFSYSMLYLPANWLQAGLGGIRDDGIGFRATLGDDPGLGAAIRHACDLLGRPRERLARDAALDAVVSALRPHLGRPMRETGPGSAPAGPVARRARDLLHSAMAEDPGADALAHSAGASDRFTLARAFRAAYGTSPHAYLVQLRLTEARRRLQRGQAPAVVAADCGFADQSHFGRWFRRAYGLTPAAYRSCCTNVPDKSR
jgi:AraC-like DNA-binding protein